MILIAYDGSEDSKAAVEEAAKLFPGQRATVLTVWQRYIDTMTRAGAGLAMMTDFDDIDEASGKMAAEKAAEGAQIASGAGMDAQTRTAVVDTTVAEKIIHEAGTVDASAIVIGTRGLTGVKSLLLGSTSHAVLQHADRPVVVIPSPVVAADRASHLSSR